MAKHRKNDDPEDIPLSCGALTGQVRSFAHDTVDGKDLKWWIFVGPGCQETKRLPPRNVVSWLRRTWEIQGSAQCRNIVTLHHKLAIMRSDPRPSRGDGRWRRVEFDFWLGRRYFLKN